MRHLIDTYTFEAGTRTIQLPDPDLFGAVGIENIRLIVNETQKKVLCSSMQKDLITDITDNAITYASSLPALASDDKLTIELDMGDDYYIKGEDWLINTIKGISTVITRAQGARFATISGRSYMMYQLFQSTEIIAADLQDVTSIGEGGAYHAFADCKALLSVDLRNLSIDSAEGIFYGCSRLKQVNLDSLTSIKKWLFAFRNCESLEELSLPNVEDLLGNGSNVKGFLYGCINLRRLSMPKFRGVGQYSATGEFFYNCTALEEIDFSSYIATGGTLSLEQCTALKKITMPCGNLSQTNSYNILYNVPSIVTIVLVGNATNNINFLWQPNLSFESVRNILTAANNAAINGKTVSFYSSGLTITDDSEGALMMLKTEVEAKGGTIANLTITPYSA